MSGITILDTTAILEVRNCIWIASPPPALWCCVIWSHIFNYRFSALDYCLKLSY